MSIFPQAFYFIIDVDISAPGHNIEVVDGLNAIEIFIFELLSTMKLLGEKGYDTRMVIHTGKSYIWY